MTKDGIAFVPPAEGGMLAADGRPLTLSDVAALARGRDYVLLGEHHGNPCVQQAQAAVALAMAQDGNAPAVGVEWVSVDRQGVLDEFNAGRIPVGELRGRLDWDRTWGHAWASYAPVFRQLRDAGLGVSALNLPREVVRAAGEAGADDKDGGLGRLTPEQRAMLPRQVILPAPEQQAELQRAFAAHAAREKLSGEELRRRQERFFFVQSLWDTAMAENAIRLRRATGRPVAVLAGSGHVEFGWGVARRLRELDPGARILLALPWSGPLGGEGPPEGADIFYFCPPMQVSRLGVTLRQEDGRLTVAGVEPGSRAAKAGLRDGDVLERMGETDIRGLDDLAEAGMRARKAGGPLAVTVLREGHRVRLDLGEMVAAPEGLARDEKPMSQDR